MTVSLIIATRNAGTHLHSCLESIARQSVLPAQVIVQDGQSSDGTQEILCSYETKLGGILDWRSEPDSGIAEAWNRALERTTGGWILFLGADDTLHDRDTLQRAARSLDRLPPHVRVAYGRVALCHEDETPFRVLGREWSACAHNFRQCLEFIPHQGTFHRHSLFADHGLFDTSLAIGCDYDFLLRELMSEDAFYLGPAIISRMMSGGVSTSRQHILRVNTERILLHRRHVGTGVPLQLYWKAAKALAISLLHWAGGDALALQSTNLYRRWLRNKPPLLR